MNLSLPYDAVGAMTLLQVMNLQARGKPLDARAAFDTFEDFARYRRSL